MKTDPTTLSPLLETLRAELRRSGLSRLIVGLSGGADSTALLRGLASLCDRERLTLTAVHCNFRLRGEESERDERFCRRLCEEIGISLKIFECPVNEWRRTHGGGSDEIACREMRYARFREEMEETGSEAIAIAHNSDDQAETLLLNLMRGAGSTGLKGMRVLSNGIFRPLLGISRAEILSYLKSIGQDYVTDSTNMESVYRRNFLRNRVIPLLEEEWPEARRSLCRSASILERENRVVKWAVERLLPEGSSELLRSRIEGFPDPELLFRQLLLPHGASATLISDIASTSSLPYSGRRWHLPDGSRLWENREGWAVLEKETDCVPELYKEEFVYTKELMARIRRAPLTEFWADSDLEVEWRPWRQGDRIRPLGMKGSRLVSDVLSDAKLPRSEKERFHVLALPASSEVLWVPGLKRSRLHLVENPPKVILRKVEE